jgi:hypothetical protein
MDRKGWLLGAFFLGALGASTTIWGILCLLPATREEKPRQPLPTRTIGGTVHYLSSASLPEYPFTFTNTSTA